MKAILDEITGSISMIETSFPKLGHASALQGDYITQQSTTRKVEKRDDNRQGRLKE